MAPIPTLQSNMDVGPSFPKYVLDNVQLHGLTETEMAFLAGTYVTAGSDTPHVFPEEQAKVQAEMDAVVGRNRLPTFADEQSLLRLHAFISDGLRWRLLIRGGGYPLCRFCTRVGLLNDQGGYLGKLLYSSWDHGIQQSLVSVVLQEKYKGQDATVSAYASVKLAPYSPGFPSDSGSYAAAG
ncbi:hypothetical protein EDB19DRAFT_1832371 [Suillus lakei]|nr:hypothetical protein EDB19DRAFT_1832371 [Suillus lakei]